MCGQQGLPVRLEPELEGGREQQVSGEQRWAPGEGRSVQLEQQPDSLWAGVDGERLSELWGHTERSACAHWTRDETAVFRVDLLLFSLMSHMETNSTWATPSFSTSSFSRSHLQLLCFVCFIQDYIIQSCALSSSRDFVKIQSINNILALCLWVFLCHLRFRSLAHILYINFTQWCMKTPADSWWNKHAAKLWTSQIKW